MATYYFDASDAGPTDPNAVWTNDANAFDGNVSTSASTNTAGDTSSNYLMGEGTNAPTSGTSVILVKARIYGGVAFATVFGAIYTDGLGELLGTPSKGGTGWGSFVELTVPAGGWTWSKIASLEVKIYGTLNPDGSPTVMKVEIEAYSDPIPNRIYRIQGFQ